MKKIQNKKKIHWAVLLLGLTLPGIVEAQDKTHRYEVTLALTRPVPARLSCTIEGGDSLSAFGTRTRTVDFDPVDDLPLMRTVRLSVRSSAILTELRVLCRSTPFRISAGTKAETVVEFWGDKKDVVVGSPASSLELKARTWSVSTVLLNSAKPISVVKPIDVVTPPYIGELSITAKTVNVSKLSTLSPQAGLSVASTRSLDLLTKVGQELLETTAEVVVERAKRRGMSILNRKLKKGVCEDMVVGNTSKSALAIAARKATAENENSRLLPRTCDALQGIDLADIMASGEILRRSLTGDLVNFATGTIENYVDDALKKVLGEAERKRVSVILRAVTSLAVRLAEGEKTLTEGDFQFFTLTLAHLGGKQPSAASPVLLALHGALISLTECLAEGTCEADRLAHLVQSYLNDQLEGKYVDVAGITSVALRAKQVLRPPPGASPAEVANVSLHLAIDVVQLILEQDLKKTSKYLIEKSELLRIDVKKKFLKKLEDNNFDPDGSTADSAFQIVEQQAKLKSPSADLRKSFLDTLDRQSFDSTLAGEIFDELVSDVTQTVTFGGSPKHFKPKEEFLEDLGGLGVNLDDQSKKTCAENWFKSLQEVSTRNQLNEEEFLAKLKTLGADLGKSTKKTDAGKLFKNLKDDSKQKVLALLPRLRALLDGVTRRDLAGGLQAAIPLVIAATTDNCTNCVVKMSDANLKKWFRIVGAIVSYSTSYAKIEGDDHAAIEKQRQEIRKKAMNDLIDAATDRSGRDGDDIWSLGASVGFGRFAFSKNGTNSGTDCSKGNSDEGANKCEFALSIPLGLSYEKGVGGKSAFHIQLSALDLANYLRKGEGGEAIDPDFLTAVDLNFRASITFGEYVDVGAVIGWTPFQEIDGVVSDLQGGYAGIFVGTYIPILDLN